eukprot:TRINITY_DN981_c1_g1_i4.p1 TRINITY_DN981_c1_g1~~TRINITY_DN981_c1_g1_i4.p1  ORF type:complete len:656 (-),score=151.98 TRINITY_DN981_c1_g1_i4:478-2151(-)
MGQAYHALPDLSSPAKFKTSLASLLSAVPQTVEEGAEASKDIQETAVATLAPEVPVVAEVAPPEAPVVAEAPPATRMAAFAESSAAELGEVLQISSASDSQHNTDTQVDSHNDSTPRVSASTKEAVACAGIAVKTPPKPGTAWRLSAKQLEDARKLFAALDSNGDGSVTADEIASAMHREKQDRVVQELMSLLDNDGNGSISFIELVRGLEKMGQAYSAVPDLTSMANFSKSFVMITKLEDDSGEAPRALQPSPPAAELPAQQQPVSAAAVPVSAALAAAMSTALSDATAQDQKSAMKQPPPKLRLGPEQLEHARQLFSCFDANGDGQAADEEIAAAMKRSSKDPVVQELISFLDSDHNGSVSFIELVRGLERMWQMYNFVPDLSSIDHFSKSLAAMPKAKKSGQTPPASPQSLPSPRTSPLTSPLTSPRRGGDFLPSPRQRGAMLTLPLDTGSAGMHADSHIRGTTSPKQNSGTSPRQGIGIPALSLTPPMPVITLPSPKQVSLTAVSPRRAETVISPRQKAAMLTIDLSTLITSELRPGKPGVYYFTQQQKPGIF